MNSLSGPSPEAIASEYAAGRDLARSFESTVSLDEDPQTVAWIEGVAEKLAARLANQERRWRIVTIRDPEPGAFALPGGFLYVTSGLLEICARDENEIAWVVGHEMGHVVRGHAAARLASQILGSVTTRVAVGPPGALGQWILATGVRALTRAYSRNQELEVDEFGAKLAAAAGFDAEAALRVCSRLERFEQQSAQPLAEYFASHPPLALRAERLGRWLEAHRHG